MPPYLGHVSIIAVRTVSTILQLEFQYQELESVFSTVLEYSSATINSSSSSLRARCMRISFRARWLYEYSSTRVPVSLATRPAHPSECASASPGPLARPSSTPSRLPPAYCACSRTSGAPQTRRSRTWPSSRTSGRCWCGAGPRAAASKPRDAQGYTTRTMRKNTAHEEFPRRNAAANNPKQTMRAPDFVQCDSDTLPQELPAGDLAADGALAFY